MEGACKLSQNRHTFDKPADFANNYFMVGFPKILRQIHPNQFLNKNEQMRKIRNCAAIPLHKVML